MSLIEIEFMKTNEKFIKYEDEQKVELGDDSSGAGDISRDDSYKAKCGEIFVSNCGLFSFLCTFCDESFGSIHLFVQHMQKNHLNMQEQSEDPLDLDGDQETEAAIKSEAISDEEHNSNISSDINNYEDVNKEKQPDTDFLKDFRAFLDKTLYENNHDDDDDRSVTSNRSISEKDPVTNPDLYCDICDRQYSTNSGFTRHKSLHEIVSNSDDSFNAFEDSNDTNYREKAREPKRVISPLKCRYCHQYFKDKATRISHERIHTGEKPFKCQHCGKCFRTKRLLNNHLMIHSGLRPHKCLYCGVAFTHKMNLVVHIRAHLGDKRYKCDYCDKRFVRNVDRRIHMRSHTGEKPYQCEWCGTSYSTSSKLTEHRKRHTNTRPYKCDICEKSFYSGNLLKNHQVCHSGERPFQCNICFSSFPRKRALQSHVKIHSDVKEYVCSICEKAFAQNAGLYCHMKSHGVQVKKSTFEYDVTLDEAY